MKYFNEILNTIYMQRLLIFRVLNLHLLKAIISILNYINMNIKRNSFKDVYTNYCQ